ncbi:uncharacterized protein LACBIDRAFT_301926 [Laccaria bicolor S238N-H82]|uniref:Predicted protein n=1 Tax=Laccaria bicolor (strain S238N-H82 / ATCC MYA-4686) TaxID=486041 RepID=B0CPY0_LACBS|nr:uncharacterized protein LACBIDRAFT_301926 [Laccaria bicolor S238N-H82]EDR15491.1 predicted protein [Laccaria bicolor S238N-H82]|eukprot:XP_001873699.1 predicted protein [Laccaria bicolor S238N-H82]
MIGLLEADLTIVDFGLGQRELDELQGVTHIIHNAWPVNFNLRLSSFEPHLKGLCYLIRLALLNTGTIRIIFTSLIAVQVAILLLPPLSLSPPLHRRRSPPIVQVPEIPLDATHPAPFGYAQAKWVCGRLLESVNQLYGSAVRASVVRLGQITGTIDKEAWNEWEHVPLMVRTGLCRVWGSCLICGGQPHGSPSTAQVKSSSTSYYRHSSN